MNVIPGSAVSFTPGTAVMRGDGVARAVPRGVVLRVRNDVAPRADEGRRREERSARAEYAGAVHAYALRIASLSKV